jgi:ATP-dependent protease ClpP protease subunit
MEKWFNIQANAGTIKVDVVGEIGGYGVTARDFIAEVSNQKGKVIEVNMSSYGGDVNEAFQIYDYLKAFNGEVRVNITGFTASAGTLISMGADEVVISSNAQFLIHNSWTIAMGNAEEMRAKAEELDKVDNSQVRIYTAKTGLGESEIRELMAEEKWLDAEEAKEKGFVDRVTDYSEISAESLEVIYAKIEANELPKANFKLIDKSEKMADKTILEAINAKFEELKGEFNALFGTKEEDKVETIAKADAEALLETAKAELETEYKYELSEKEDEINAKSEELVTVKEELETVKANYTEKVKGFEAKVEELEAEIAKAKATKVETPKTEEAGNVETPKAEVVEGFDLLAERLKK